MYFLGEYEPATTRLLRRLARPAWTVFDIGANVGYFSVTAAIAGGSGSQVVAFEPNPTVAEMLSATMSLNPDLDMTVEQVAVGDTRGELPLHLTSISRNSGLSSLRGDLPDTEGATVQVSVTTIDDYCDEHGCEPDLLKIDVEGFERQVIEGARLTLSRRSPGAVICEIARDRDDPDELVAAMAAHGYTAHSIASDGQPAPLRLDPAATFENICFLSRARA
jgi:FkbM family methyltransferase